MKKLILLLTAIMIFTLTGADASQTGKIGDPSQGASVGIVDLDLLFILHPLMADYVPEEKAFKLTKGSKGAKEEGNLRDSAQKNLMKAREQVAAYGEAFDQTMEEYQDLIRQAAENYRKRIYGLTATASILYENESYKQEIEILKTKYEPKLDNFSKNMAGGTEKCREYEDYLSTPGFTSYNTTQNHIGSILKEILKAVEYEGKKQNLTLITNSSFLKTRPKRDSKSHNPRLHSKTYGDILRFNVDEALKQSSNEKKPIISELKNKITAHIESSLNNENNILTDWHYMFPSGNILFGGKNITVDVLEQLMFKHKVSKTTADLIKQSVKELINR